MQILRDNILNEKLHTDGYVKIPLLQTEAIQRLLQLYNNSPNAKNPYFGFHVTLDLQSSEQIENISKEIVSVIDDAVQEFLQGFKYISPRFAVKEASQNSLIPPHQDWSFVDESLYQSYNLWVAVTPCTLQNGTLGFLKDSHSKLSNIRATPLPIFEVPFQEYAYDLTESLDFVELQAGDALLFNSRIIHASKPNTTAHPRVNLAIEITDAQAPLIHYNISADRRRIRTYAIDESFFYKYSNAKLTDMYKNKKDIIDFPKLAEFENKIIKISKKELLT